MTPSLKRDSLNGEMAALFILLQTLAQTPVAADPQLDAARLALRAMDYNRCVLLANERAQTPSSREEDIADAKLLAGVCALSAGRTAEAESAFADALAANPQIEMLPKVSPKVREVFAAQKDTFVAQKKHVSPSDGAKTNDDVNLSTPPLPPDRQLASNALLQNSTQPMTPSQPSFLSRIPWVSRILAGFSVLTLAGGVVFGVLAQSNYRQSQTAQFASERLTAYGVAQTNATAANALYAGAGVLLTSSILVALLFPAAEAH